MANRNSFPLIRGHRMRITRLDGCGMPQIGQGSSVVTSGFVSIATTAQITEAEVIEVTNAGGQVCARDPGTPSFNGYSLDITFCDVQPCTFELMTGQPPVLDANGDTIGFRMNSAMVKEAKQTQAFALEVWLGVPGEACGGGGEGSFGYILFPFVGSGTVGDFTIENAALNFVISGAATRDGNAWGAGPYDDIVTDAPGRLPSSADPNDHMQTLYTTSSPPDPTDGCVELTAPTAIAITGVTAGKPGSYQPPNADRPANLTALKADAVIGDLGSSKPTTAWAVGEYIVLADSSNAFWNGTVWASGKATAGALSAAATSSKKK